MCCYSAVLEVFSSEHKVLYLSISCNDNVFQSSTRSGNIEKKPGKGEGAHPLPQGKRKTFQYFHFRWAILAL